MKTLNTVLPIYDRISKQCYERSKNVGGDKKMLVPVITPRFRLPALQWDVSDDNSGELTEILLVSQKGVKDITNEFNITNKYAYHWANSGYNEFEANFPGSAEPAEIKTCVKNQSSGEQCTILVVAEDGSLNVPIYDRSEDVVRLDITFTLLSGDLPKIELRDYFAAETAYSNTVTLKEGRNVIYLIPAGNTETELSVVIYNSDGELSNFRLTHNNYFGFGSFHPRLYGSGYFMLKDHYLANLLSPGEYYLKMTSLEGFVYYSDWFLVDCAYKNYLTKWADGDHTTYDIFETDGTAIIKAVTSGYAAADESYPINVIKNELYYFICNMTLENGVLPTVDLYDFNNYRVISDVIQLKKGLNVIELRPDTTCDKTGIILRNTPAGEWSMTEALLIDYSRKYLKLDFYHTCNLGDINYEDGFRQTLFLDAEPMEDEYPYVERGIENGLGVFIPSFQRQDKMRIVRTKLVTSFLVDVLHRLKMHHYVTLTDLVGDVWDVKQIDTEHEWFGEDKYYALATMTMDLDEAVVTTACCKKADECLQEYVTEAMLTAGEVTDIETIVTEEPYNILILDGEGTDITAGLQVRIGLDGGVYHLYIYSVDAIQVRIKLLY